MVEDVERARKRRRRNRAGSRLQFQQPIEENEAQRNLPTSTETPG